MHFLPLVNFIFLHFLKEKVNHISFLTCWSLNENTELVRRASALLINVDFPKTLNHPPLKNIGVLLDANCNNTFNIIEQADNIELFNSSHYNWLIIDRKSDNNFLKVFINTSMTIDTQMAYANIQKFNYDIEIQSNTKLKSNLTQIIIRLYDVYNNGQKFGGILNVTFDRQLRCDLVDCKLEIISALHLRSKYGNRCSMRDLNIPVGTVFTAVPITLPHEVLMKIVESEKDFQDYFPKLGYRLIVPLQDIFLYNVTYIHSSAWSTKENTGGSIGDLANGKILLIASPYLITIGRLQYVSILVHCSKFRSIFVFRTPHNEGIIGKVFLKPFSPSVWCSTLLTIIAFSCLFKLSFHIEKLNFQNSLFIPSWLFVFLISFGVTCCQGALLLPKTKGGKIALFTLSLVMFILYNYYTSIVVSSLIGTPIKSSIKTLPQLADSKLEIGIEKIPYTMAFLNTSQIPDVQYFVKKRLPPSKKETPNLFLKSTEGVLRVRDGGYAYHLEKSSVYRLIENLFSPEEICDINEVQLRSENALGLIIRKGSPYQEIFKQKLFWMLENGIISKHREFWTKSKLYCFQSSILVTVGLEYTAALFILLLLSYIISLIVLIIEIIVHKYNIVKYPTISN